MEGSLLEQPGDDFVIRCDYMPVVLAQRPVCHSLEVPMDFCWCRSYANALTRCIQAHRPCSSEQEHKQGPADKASALQRPTLFIQVCTAANRALTCCSTLRQADQQSAAPARPGTKPRGVRHHGYTAAKERAAAELDRQQTQERRDAACTSAAAPHSYEIADAAEPPHAAPQSATQASVPGKERAAYGEPGAHDSWDAAWAWWAPPPPPPPPPPLPAWLFSRQGPAGYQPPAVSQPASPSRAPSAAGSRSGGHGTPALALDGDGSELQAAAQAQASKLGDEALAELLTAWFRAGFLSGQHAARAAVLSSAMS